MSCTGRTLYRQLLVTELLLVWISNIQAKEILWQQILGTTKTTDGGRLNPSIRYSQAAVQHKGDLVITSGYYYDAVNHQPVWLSDTWALKLSEPFQWKKLHGGLGQHEAVKAYRSGKAPKAPSGRYGASAVLYRDSIYLFGGTDGGYSKHGEQDYRQGFEMDELWRFSLASNKWQLLHNRAATKPFSRSLHTAVLLGSCMLVFGGNAAGSGEVWKYDLEVSEWQQLASSTAGDAEAGPGDLLGHAAFAAKNGSGFYVYGGRRFAAARGEMNGDVWFFDVARRQWQMRQPSADCPKPRLYHAAAALGTEGGLDQTHAVISSGSLHQPTMQCSTETWLLRVEAAGAVAWLKLPDHPLGHYHHTLVAYRDSIISFGGHLCSSGNGPAGGPFYYTNAVHVLNVSRWLEEGRTVGSAAARDAPVWSSGRELQGEL